MSHPRSARYRLRRLSAATGRPYTYFTGSLIYLLRMAARGRPGRYWIELNHEPAVTVHTTHTAIVERPRERPSD